jgi:purine-binding chemotaxis protein CheW
VIADKIGTEYVMGVGKLDNRLLIRLNLAKVLGAKELHNIQSISAEAAGEAATL